jgi:gliotoxin/aspirochlorine biosynthesis thioredoxin reductase
MLILGFAELWGTRIINCVFDNGYEFKHCACASIGANMQGWSSAATGLTLASTMQLFPDIESASTLASDMMEKLEGLKAAGVEIMPYKKVVKLTLEPSGDVSIHLSDGSKYSTYWILYQPKTTLATPELVSQLGLELTPTGDIEVIDASQRTNVYGVFAAGNCATIVKNIPTAAAEGVAAGAGVHFQLAMEQTSVEKIART